MNTITLDGVTHTAPSSWDELSADELTTWAKICAKKDLSEGSAIRLAAVCFYKIKKDIFFQLNAAQQVQLVSTLNFLFDSTPVISNWLFPVIRPSIFTTLYGPANRLSSSTIKEFRYTELLYSLHQNRPSAEAVDRLLAVLFREKKPGAENDIRSDLNEMGINSRLKLVKKIPAQTKAAILFNYMGCRNYLISRYPTIFPVSDSSQAAGPVDLQGMIRTVAGGKFGHYHQTEQTGIYLFLDHLRDEIAEHKKNA